MYNISVIIYSVTRMAGSHEWIVHVEKKSSRFGLALRIGLAARPRGGAVAAALEVDELGLVPLLCVLVDPRRPQLHAEHSRRLQVARVPTAGSVFNGGIEKCRTTGPCHQVLQCCTTVQCAHPQIHNIFERNCEINPQFSCSAGPRTKSKGMCFRGMRHS